MSGTIIAKPLRKQIIIKCSTPSQFIEIIENTFGELPITFNNSDLPRLGALAHYKEIVEYNKGENPFQDIIDLIDKYGEVQIDVQY